MISKPYKSKLLPYKELIRKLRKQGYSYNEIAILLKEQYEVSTTRHNIFYFVKARQKKRKAIEMADDVPERDDAIALPEEKTCDLLGKQYEQIVPVPEPASVRIEKKPKEKLTPEQRERKERWKKVKQAAEDNFKKTW